MSVKKFSLGTSLDMIDQLEATILEQIFSNSVYYECEI